MVGGKPIVWEGCALIYIFGRIQDFVQGGVQGTKSTEGGGGATLRIKEKHFKIGRQICSEGGAHPLDPPLGSIYFSKCQHAVPLCASFQYSTKKVFLQYTYMFNTKYTFLKVYWTGPIIGSLIACLVHYLASNFPVITDEDMMVSGEAIDMQHEVFQHQSEYHEHVSDKVSDMLAPESPRFQQVPTEMKTYL
jgi:hypothetical protein